MEYFVCAAETIKSKSPSQKNKLRCQQKIYHQLENSVDIEDDDVLLGLGEEGQPSNSVFDSLITDRKVERRNAICERSHSDRLLLKEALRMYMQKINCTEYNIR